MTPVRYRYVKKEMMKWQSNLSANPPWPGILSAKSLISKLLLSPLARKPPKGAMMLANNAITEA